MVENRETTAISAMRSAVEHFALEHRHPPTVSEVAAALSMNLKDFRELFVRERHGTGITLHALGIWPAHVSQQRAALRALLSELTSPRSKIFAIHQILDLVSQRQISSLGARTLTYAVLTGNSEYSTLDVPFAALIGTYPRSISDTLHTAKRKARWKGGLISQLEDYLFGSGVSDSPVRQKRAEEIISRISGLRRDYVRMHPVTEFLNCRKPSAELRELVFSTTFPLLEHTYPKEHFILGAHLELIRQLADTKVSGTFTTRKAFATERNLDVSGVSHLLSGGTRGVSLGERIIAAAHHLQLQEQEKLPDILSKLQKRATHLSSQERDSLFRMLELIELHQILRDPPQNLTTRLLIEAHGNSGVTRKQDFAQRVGVSCPALSRIIHGRSNQRGVIHALDRLMQLKFPDALSKIVEILAPAQTHFTPGLLRCFAQTTLPTLRKPSLASRRKCSNRGGHEAKASSFASTYELNPGESRFNSAKHELAKSIVTISAEVAHTAKFSFHLLTPSRREGRQLTIHERHLLLEAFFLDAHGNIPLLARTLAARFKMTYPVSVNPDTLTRYLLGRRVRPSSRLGAITRFVTSLQSHAPLLAALDQDDEETSRALVMQTLGNSQLIGWATRIASASSPKMAANEVLLFCATRPGTVRDICSVALSIAATAKDTKSCQILASWRDLAHSTNTQMRDRNSVILLRSACSQHGGELSHFFATVLIAACFKRSVSADDAASFLKELHETDDWDVARSLVESWGKLCAASIDLGLSGRERAFARRCFTRFSEISYGCDLTPSELESYRFSYFKLDLLAQERRAKKTAEEFRVANLITQFFEQYEIESIVASFCYDLCQSSTKRLGLPHSTLCEIANDQVYQAAKQYDPEHVGKSGKKAAFSSFVIQSIRWACLDAFRQHVRMAAVIPARLEQRVGDSEDGDLTLGSTLSDEGVGSRPKHAAQNSSDQLDTLLEELLPVERRVLELRFQLREEDRDSTENVNRRISEILCEEGFRDEKVSAERIRQLINRAIFKLRRAFARGTIGEWCSFFSSATTREAPEPLFVISHANTLHIMEGLRFPLRPEEVGTPLIFDVLRVDEGNRRAECEITIRSRDANDLADLGLYVVVTTKGAIVTCERVS